MPLTFQQIAAIALAFSVSAMCADAPESKAGADLLKTDVLGVFAHPDDETGVAATLAYYAHARGAVVANVYCTRGEGGGNMVGTQWGASLGVLREAELRDCLAVLGVRYCYFLDRLDWAYTESVRATLEKWDKEAALERLVRLLRALRPEVIVTMNPAPTPGQHGHHQAAGVLATEAFTAAADKGRFPDQISREGLEVWQVRRLYYSGGATNGPGATIIVNETLPDGRTPASIAGKALANHRSQAFGNFSDSPWLQRPQRFLLVRSLVPVAGGEKDLLGGLPVAEDALKPVEFNQGPAERAVTLRFSPRPAVAKYESWIREQKIPHVAAQFQPDLPVVSGEANDLALEIANGSSEPVEGDLVATVPSNWQINFARQHIGVAPGQKSVMRLSLTAPLDAEADQELKFTFSPKVGEQIAMTKLHPVPRLRVARVPEMIPLDSDEKWVALTATEISLTRLVQGKVRDAADSSATFRMAHNGSALFIDVTVRDDRIVTNIAPNDIRGHWRSDSVEICLDPEAGAEHTMNCYKIGIFPFDTTGQVRAARDADANQGPIEETAPGTKVFSRRTADGYIVRAAIPFGEIGLKAGQKRVGFNVIIYDGDKEAAAVGENVNKSRIAWAPRSGVQGRPEDWGRLDLE